jgi:hypothetical protein
MTTASARNAWARGVTSGVLLLSAGVLVTSGIVTV